MHVEWKYANMKIEHIIKFMNTKNNQGNEIDDIIKPGDEEESGIEFEWLTTWQTKWEIIQKVRNLAVGLFVKSTVKSFIAHMNHLKDKYKVEKKLSIIWSWYNKTNLINKIKIDIYLIWSISKYFM